MLDVEVRREVGQHFICGFHGTEPSAEIRTLIQDYFLSAIILFKRNVTDVFQTRQLVDSLQLLAREAGHSQPLLIGIDQENGLVSAFSSRDDSENGGTQFPGAMALAASGSLDLTESVYSATGREMHLAGINWSFSPVCDVNSDPRNPVIDPNRVAALASAAAKGLANAGIAACLKHFPGHGDTHVDSHLGLPRIMKTMDQLAQVELIPFRHLIREETPSIMSGHMALPLLHENNEDTPGSLSRRITDGLLRQDLTFDGVIVTDCLEMQAIVDASGTEEGAVKALSAGADIAMICHRFDRQKGAFHAVYSALETDKLALSDLQRSRSRIDGLRKRVAQWSPPPLTQEAWTRVKEENIALTKNAYRSSISLASNPVNWTPIEPTAGILLLTPRMEGLNAAVDDEGQLLTEDDQLRNTAGPSYISFARSISRRCDTVKHVVYEQGLKVDQSLLRSVSHVIFATREAHRGPWQLDTLRILIDSLAGLDPPKIILCTTCTPYDLFQASDLNLTSFATFEYTAPALEALSAVLFGEQQATGIVPVSVSL